jgi:hypothetical protein
VRLAPMQPPGRLNRKARDFEAEVKQLRARGYTLEAIRQALARAGVHVSLSTVRREAMRDAAPSPAAAPSSNAVAVLPPSPSPLPPPSPSHATAVSAIPTGWTNTPGLPKRASGKEIAEAFLSRRIHNPLIRAKEPS